MSRKGFLVTVEIDVRKVSCPGVCLCSNGKVSLQLHVFESSVQTRNAKPAFPLRFYEKFVFSKTFDEDRRLNELQRRLNREEIYVELIQWRNCDKGQVLSTFRTTLDDLLYPSTLRGSIMGVSVDLLMEPTGIFPGTIAPKLEVSTKTTVEQIIFDPYSTDSNITLVTPKALPCKPTNTSNKNPNQPRKVCHSIGYSRRQKDCSAGVKTKNKPPFKHYKVPDDLIVRTNPQVVDNDKYSNQRSCYCRHAACGTSEQVSQVWHDGHASEIRRHDNHCSTCSFYDNYFLRNPSKPQYLQYQHSSAGGAKSPSMVCSYCDRHLSAPRKVHVPSGRGSPCESDRDYVDSNRNCSCLPFETPSTLAQLLHDKLSRTLEANQRMMQKCVDC